MSDFKNIRVVVSHGSRSAVVSWETAVTGVVYLAYSDWGIKGSWKPVNTVGVAHTVGSITDDDLQIDSGLTVGYYRLLLVDEDDVNHFSETIAIVGDLTPNEFSIVRSIIKAEYKIMYARDGYPVWHCIPRDFGDRPARFNQATERIDGPPCDGEVDTDYGTGFVGGFFEPVLTWMKPSSINNGSTKTDEQGDAAVESVDMKVRMLAWPRPARGHMLIDPSNDRRFLVTGAIQTHRFRDVVPIAHDVDLQFMNQGDVRYKFQPPVMDTKEYRRLPYWSPMS